MMHVVVVGGSFAGLTAAEELRRRFGPQARISVVDPSRRFEFRPSLPWLVFGRRRPRDIAVPREPLLRARGVRFIHAAAKKIDPKENIVHTDKGVQRYDFLVLATGGTSPPASAEPLDARGFSPLWIDESLRLRQELNRFTGGAVVVAIHPRTPLTCPAYEYVFQMAAYARRRGLRRSTSISLVTYEKRPFEFGGPGAGRLVDRWLKQEGVRFMPETFVEAATNRTVTLADRHVLSAELVVYIPPLRGGGFLRKTPGLTDTEGFVLTDGQLRSHAYGNVFAAGDCVALPGPKSALTAELQAKTVATNIAADCGLARHANYKSLLGCMMDLGPGRGLLAVRKPAPQQGRTRTYFVLPGGVNRFAKVAFEQYFLRRRLRA